MWFVITAATECVLSTLKHIWENVAHEWHDLTCNTIFTMVHYAALWRVSTFPSHHYRVRDVTVQYWQIKTYKIVYKQFPFFAREWTGTWGLHMLVMCEIYCEYTDCHKVNDRVSWWCRYHSLGDGRRKASLWRHPSNESECLSFIINCHR